MSHVATAYREARAKFTANWKLAAQVTSAKHFSASEEDFTISDRKSGRYSF
jgi:hypothetical protein